MSIRICRPLGLVVVVTMGLAIAMAGMTGCRASASAGGDRPAAGPRPPGLGGQLPPGHQKKRGGDGAHIEVEVGR